KEASAIQSQLPGLEKAAALEAQRVARAKQIAATYEAIEKSFAKGAPKPFTVIPKVDPTKGIEALFGPQAKNPLEGAPEIGVAFADLTHAMDGVVHDTAIGKQALDDFYTQWRQRARGTVDSINEDYDAQIAHFDGLLHLGEISQEQFNDVSLKLERERQAGLKQLRQDTGTSTWRDAWSDLFKDLDRMGKDFARSITQDIGNAIEDLNRSLAQMVATGQGLNLKEVGQNLSANLTASALRKGESLLFGSLGNLFGL